MKTQLSLLALVVAILAGQASSVSVSPLREYYESIGKELNSIEKLSSEEVVSRLSGGGYNPTEVEKFLYSADDKSVEICNAHTIGELLALNEVDENGQDDCTTEALDERAKYCSGLAKEALEVHEADFACKNIHRFCDNNVEGVKEYCEKRKKFEYMKKKFLEPIDPQNALRVLRSGELTDSQIYPFAVLSTYKNVVVCNGFKFGDLYAGLFDIRDCSKDGLKKKFNSCESLKTKDSDLACSNVRYYCRHRLGAAVSFCINPLTPKSMVTLDEQTVKDLTEANYDENVKDYGGPLRIEFREKMSPVEEIIAKF